MYITAWLRSLGLEHYADMRIIPCIVAGIAYTDAETLAHLKRSSALVISTSLRWGWSGSATARPGMRSGTRSGHAGMRSDMRPCNLEGIRIYIRI